MRQHDVTLYGSSKVYKSFLFQVRTFTDLNFLLKTFD